MRYLTLFVLLAALLFSELPPSSVKAQSRAQEKVESLRSQLLEVEAKQAQLQTRLQQLDEEVKPENIEKNLAGVGSTRPEDLREQRRRQLEIERNGVQSQLNLMTTSHTRLETAIAQAETEAYRQSAAPPIVVPDPNASPAATPAAGANDPSATPVRPRRARKKKTRKAKRTSRPA